MGYLSEKISYIRGLADGLELGEESSEAKVISAIIELLDDMAFSVEELEEQQDLLNDDLDEMDEIVGELEEYVYGDDYDDYDDITFEDVICPACGAEIELDEDMISDDGSSFICPACHEEIDIDWECDGDCDSCDPDDEE